MFSKKRSAVTLLLIGLASATTALAQIVPPSPVQPLGHSGHVGRSLISENTGQTIIPPLMFSTDKIVEAISWKAPNLDPRVLRLGLKAYQCAKRAGIKTKPMLTIIDFSKPSAEKRLWVIDLKDNQVPYQTHVAHGAGSGGRYVLDLSDMPQSHTSSIGLYLTQGTYYGHDGYSLRLKGLDQGFNDHALQRDIVIHGAAYVSPSFIKRLGRVGRSWGCPALNKAVAGPVINKVKNHTLIFAYYPQQDWLNKSKYLHCPQVD